MLTLLLLLILAICAYWHYTQNNTLARKWQAEYGEEKAKQLSRFIWNHSIHFLTALTCCVLMASLYDWRIREMNLNISALIRSQAEELAKKQTAQAAPSYPQQVYPPVIATPPEPQPAQEVELAPSEPMEEEPITAYETPQASVDSNAGLADVYTPETTNNDQQAAIDLIKQRYEGLLVTYFFLNKCKLIDSGDYHVIISALAREMSSVNAPGRLEYDILTAAQGSYKEMYERSSCTNEEISPLAAQYAKYIQTISENVPEH